MMIGKPAAKPMFMGLMMGAMGIAMIHFDMGGNIGLAFALAHVAALAAVLAVAAVFVMRGRARPAWLHVPSRGHMLSMMAGAILLVAVVCLACITGLVEMT